MTKSERKTVRGLAEERAEPRFLVIGRIVKPHGVRGEVRVEVHTDLPERFHWLDRVYISGRNNPVAIEGVRFHGQSVLLKLAGCDDRESAERLRNARLEIPMDQALPLEEGEYFLFQVIGLNVLTEQGEILGKVVEIIETGANNVFVVGGAGGEVLIPDIDDVVLKVDISRREMVVRIIPGLLG